MYETQDLHRQMTPRSQVTIYCDGACKGNPGPGGWGAILRSGCREKQLFGADPLTTNNRMELTAAIAALESLKAPCIVTVVSDSQYLVKGMSEWINGWVRKGHLQPGGKTANPDLWLRLLELAKTHQITWEWVKGHAGHPENERCDELANEAIRALRQPASTPPQSPATTPILSCPESGTAGDTRPTDEIRALLGQLELAPTMAGLATAKIRELLDRLDAEGLKKKTAKKGRKKKGEKVCSK